MEKIKKSIAAILTIALLFLCTACAKEQGEPEESQELGYEENTGTKENDENIDSDDREITIAEKSKNDKNNFAAEETTTTTTADPYNGLPAPIELKLVNSNSKKTMGSATGYEMDYHMYMIEDYHGLKYLVLTCSVRSTCSDRKVNGPDFFPRVMSKSNVDFTTDLEYEVREAYDEIISIGFLATTLYPDEVVKDSYIFDFYGEKENVTVVLKPSYYGDVLSGSDNYFHGMYTGNYLFDESDWEEYVFLEFSFD